MLKLDLCPTRDFICRKWEILLALLNGFHGSFPSRESVTIFFLLFSIFLWHFCTTGLFSLETIILKVMTMSSVFILFHLDPHCIKKIAHIYRVGVSDQKLGLFKLANAAQSLSRHFQCWCTEHILDMQVLLKKFSAHESILKPLNLETKSQTHKIPPSLVH